MYHSGFGFEFYGKTLVHRGNVKPFALPHKYYIRPEAQSKKKRENNSIRF